MPFKNAIILLLLLFGAGLSAGDRSKTVAQAIPTGDIYILTRNQVTLDSHIWQYNLDSQQIAHRFTLPSLHEASPAHLFPEQEIILATEAVHSGLLPPDTLDDPGISQRIVRLWQLSDTEILVETQTQICQHIQQSSCFGYHEFLIIDQRFETTSSLYKIGYHDPMVETVGCSPGNTLLIDRVLPHPSVRKLLLEIQGVCSIHARQIIVIDYLADPVITSIQKAGGAAWSPDGAYLSYYVQDDCQTGFCQVSFKIMATEPLATPSTIAQVAVPYHSPIFTGWADHHTVLYQSPIAPGDSPVAIHWHHLVDGSTGLINNQTFLCCIYHLRGNSTYIAGTTLSSTLLVREVAPNLAIRLELPAVGNVFYNPRYPHAMIAQVDNLDTMQLITGGLDVYGFNIDDALKLNPEERFVYLTYGEISLP